MSIRYLAGALLLVALLSLLLQVNYNTAFADKDDTIVKLSGSAETMAEEQGTCTGRSATNTIKSEGVDKMSSNVINDRGYTGEGIKVAVIDWGFDITNPEICGNIVEYKSFRTDKDITGNNDDEHAVEHFYH